MLFCHSSKRPLSYELMFYLRSLASATSLLRAGRSMNRLFAAKMFESIFWESYLAQMMALITGDTFWH